MFFTQRKLEGRIRELGEYRYRDVRNFESFLAKEDKSGLVNPDVLAAWGDESAGRMGRKARGRCV